MATKKPPPFAQSKRPRRRIIQDPKGKPGRGFMSEKGTGIQDRRLNKGKETLIPTIFKGKRIDFRKAADIIHKHGGIDPENPHRGKIKTEAQDRKSGRNLSTNPGKQQKADFLKAVLKGKSQLKPKSKKSRK